MQWKVLPLCGAWPEAGDSGKIIVMENRELMALYRALLDAFGPRHWWPGETPFEVMVGAVLTQNTAWTNVERAIAALKAAGLLSPEALDAAPEGQVAELVRPSGYFNVKAKRLKSLVHWFVRRLGGEVAAADGTPTGELRRELLAVHGVGEETADSILLYTLERPVFVVDAYTRRAFSRHGAFGADASYGEMQRFFEERLPPDVALYNEYHALIVYLGKDFCRPTPRCEGCPAGKCLGVPDASIPK